MTQQRMAYDGVVAVCPTTVPYVRYSKESAHWWIARALAEALQTANLRPDEVDGFSVSSFTLAPDTAVGLVQHLGLTPRWLDHIPMGGASGVAEGRARQAAQNKVVERAGLGAREGHAAERVR